MSNSFKSYGKVDEADQLAMLEVRRKTRKRITIITLSTIVLVGVVCAAVFGTTLAHSNNNNNNDHDDNSNDNNNNALSNLVRAVCDVTLYKDACYNSIGPLVHSGQQLQPEELFLLSIQVAVTEVSRAVGYFSDQKYNGLNVDDNRTKEALRNCGGVLGLAADHLNRSLSSVGNKSSSLLDDVLEDLKTWLSAAGIYIYILINFKHFLCGECIHLDTLKFMIQTQITVSSSREFNHLGHPHWPYYL